MAKKALSAEDIFGAAKLSYNYCGICGHVPRTSPVTVLHNGIPTYIGEAPEEPNRAPLRWWDPDDGWKIGTLCRGCAIGEGALEARPKPGDYAFASTNGVADQIDTDEDPTDAILS